MNKCSKRAALFLSVAAGVLVFGGAQAMAQTAGGPQASNNNQAVDTGNGVQQVVVTAEKRTETTLNVPMGITAVTGKTLVSQQMYSLRDFVGSVPGLNLVSLREGVEIVIRGVSAGTDVNAPVATYIDDTPLVGVGPFSGGSSTTPDLDTFDMNRIEVLKGPQGTLYGANSLGGLLKYVTNAPDPSGFHAAGLVGVNSVDHGGVGDELHGMINVPLGSDLALRVVGYDNYDAGFIDDPLRGVKNINGNRYYGGRASLLWTPTTNFSIRFNTLYQRHSWADISSEDVAPGTFAPINAYTFGPGCNLCQARYIPQPGNNELQFYDGTINWDLGWAKFVSSTTYYDYSFAQARDLSLSFVSLLGGLGFSATDDYGGHSWVEDARLTSSDQGPLQWQAGVYYTSKIAHNFQDYYYFNPIPFIDVLHLGSVGTPTTYQEIAGYANLDYDVTPTFDVQVGGRYSAMSQTYAQIGGGGEAAASIGQQSEHDQVWTYSVDGRWHFRPGSMVYARVATGFAPGGPNDVDPGEALPPTFGPDSTTNYEIGLKSSLLDNHLTVDVDAYIIDWQRIQLFALIDGFGSITNGGTAVSQGLEWNINYVPVTGLTLDFNGALDDAHLTQDAPTSVGGHAGDQLPITPKVQMSASGKYERPLFNDISGFAGINWSYEGDRPGLFEGHGPRTELPSYNIVDLRAGIETKRWTLDVYAKNIGDTIGFIYSTDSYTSFPSLLAAGPQSVTVTTPRTVGVEFSANF